MKIYTAVNIAVKNKLECLSLPLTSTLVYYLEVWLEPTIVEPLMGLYSNGKRLALLSNMKTRLEVANSGKHTSLLRYSNKYGCKKFYSTGFTASPTQILRL